jgi:hypothetical protein
MVIHYIISVRVILSFLFVLYWHVGLFFVVVLFIRRKFYMSIRTKNDLTYPFSDIRMWRQIFSFVINNDDDASDYGTIILKRESIFDLHKWEGGWTIEEKKILRERGVEFSIELFLITSLIYICNKKYTIQSITFMLCI